MLINVQCNSKILDSVITVEYAARERESGERRSASPRRGRRDSPDYGRGRSPGYRQHSRYLCYLCSCD